MEPSYDDLFSNPAITMEHLTSKMMEESDLCNHSDDLTASFICPINSQIVSKEPAQNDRVKVYYDESESLLMLEELDEDDVSWTDEEEGYLSRFEELAALDSSYFLELKGRNAFGQASVRVNDPFVLFLSDFAVATFNELCKKHFKKSVDDNIYGAVATQATYFPNRFGYIFSLTIEAMEEDVAGMYEAKVFVNCFESRRTLIKFVRSPCPPLGSKFKGRNDLIHVYEALNDTQKAIEAEICSPRKGKKRSLPKLVRFQRFYTAVKGRKRSIASVRFHSLKKKYATKIGARVNAEVQAHLLKQKPWEIKRSNSGAHVNAEHEAHLLKQKPWEIKRSNSEYWSVPNQTCGLQPRGADHLCGGYDYHNPSKVLYTEVLQSILN